MKPNISSSPFWGSRKLTIISTFGSGFAVQQSIGGTWLHLNVLGLEVTASSSLHPWHLMLSITYLCAAADEILQISVVEVSGCKIKVNVVELVAPVPYLLGSCYCFYFLSCFHIFMSCFAFSVWLYGRFGWILICHSAILRKHIQGKKYWVTRMEKKIIGILVPFHPQSCSWSP